MNQPPNRLAVNLVIWPILIESIKKHAIYGQIKGSPTVYMCVPIQLLLIAWNGFFSNFRNEILFFLRSFTFNRFAYSIVKFCFYKIFYITPNYRMHTLENERRLSAMDFPFSKQFTNVSSFSSHVLPHTEYSSPIKSATYRYTPLCDLIFAHFLSFVFSKCF